METEKYKKYKQTREERLKSVKYGGNVFHLTYVGRLISEDDLRDYEELLREIESELSSFDKSGIAYAMVEDFALDVFFVLSGISVHEIISNTINSATWDTIKFVIVKIWNRVKGKEITKMTSRESHKKQVSFGMKVGLDNNTVFNFKIEGDIDEKTVLKSLDKTLLFIQEQKLNSEFKHPYLVEFDEKKGVWRPIDFEESMKKRKKVYKQ